jgi:hypothetical protein
VIPEDIMKTAREAFVQANHARAGQGAIGADGYEAAATVIARALLAERERCNEHHKAEIARLQELHGFL